MMAAAYFARHVKAKRAGQGWTARCPAHDDRTASLSIGEGEDGKLLLHCHAGCTFDQIIDAAGAERARPNGQEHSGRTSKSRIVAAYDYRDAKGELVFQVTRWAPKDFRQRRPDGKGGWIWNVKGVELVPYRLPTLLNASEVYIVEGEKDADRLVELGIVATCNPGGAGKWPDGFARWLDGRHVVILPDSDQAGRDHAEGVAAKLLKVAASVKLLQLPRLPDRGDVSDWLDAGGTVAELRAMAEAAPYWQLKASDGEVRPRALDLIWADDIEPAIDQAGLIDGLLGTTGMTVAYGESGCGKTFVIVDLACHIAANIRWRGLDVEPGVVVYVAAEGPKSVERRVWAWKRHHGVECLPLVVVRSTVDLLHGDAETIIAELAKIRATHGRTALVVIDTLARAMQGNENSPEDMGAFIAACTTIRESAETHILVVHHCGKETAKGARGHSSLRAATDVELEITKQDGSGCIRVSKARDEQEGAAYGFRLEEVELGTNAKGRRITTCVTIEADPPIAGGKKRLGANERLVFDALASTIADQPDPAPPALDIPSGVQGASVARWQDAAMRYLPQTEPKRKREAFNRALTSLVASHAVHHVQGFAWLP